MKILKTILSFVLGLLVLVSSTSFTINMHLCRGHVQHISIVEKAAPCAMELMARDMAKENKTCSTVGKKGCCEEKSVVFDGTEYQYKASKHFALSPVDFVTLSNAVVFILDYSHSTYTSQFVSYKPPLLHRDVKVMVQSFLI